MSASVWCVVQMICVCIINRDGIFFLSSSICLLQCPSRTPTSFYSYLISTTHVIFPHFWPLTIISLHQQQQCLHLALVTTCLVLQPMDCTAPCLSLNLSHSSSRLLHPAAACPPAHSTDLDQSPTPLRAALFSLTPLLPHHPQAPPWASAALADLLALAWALLLGVSALLVSG